MKTRVIYHASCTDGLGAAAAVYVLFKDKAEYIPMQYGTDLNVEEYRDCNVLIVDFSFKKSVFDALCDAAFHVTLIDHHLTAFQEFGVSEHEVFNVIEEKYYILLDNSRSGAWLAWHNLVDQNKIPKLIQHIDDRDRWQFKLENTKEIVAGFRHLVKTPKEAYKEIKASNNLNKMLTVGKVLTDKLEEEVHSHLKRVRIEMRDGLSVGIVNVTTGIMSELGEKICSTLNVHYAEMYSIDESKQLRIASLRSIGDFDVAAIAKKHGGGGHKNAAGYSICLK